MATISNLSSFVLLFVFLANSLVFSSNGEPTISASPTDKPYWTAPAITSFFPTPTADPPMRWAAPPEEEASSPMLSPGEFAGKSSSSSRFNYAAAIAGILLCSFLIFA
ncbi:hypothetical protein PHAVU_004G070400 [Phaseolus vulgaris]|uniref:Uncharacterized protein n=1 Tax=Phaseolus vulgaris TaxID=3885 RepID=V7C4A4_PHAVU|nr:hypothetical protein PHAVU_004G070400g [Phaseolus vulgaris]ESW23721.1 hypothetical protein PHAVU_004G070400g [Phaseolus vulgaris]